MILFTYPFYSNPNKITQQERKKKRKKYIKKEKMKEELVFIVLNNGTVVKCKKEDIPTILSSNRED